MRNIIVSIGCFTIKEIQQLRLKQNKSILFYFDPRPKIFEEFEKAFKNDFDVHIISEAVSCYTGIGYLFLADGASSMTEIKDYSKIEVKVRSLINVEEEIEKKYGSDNQKSLFMNCEGAEIPIILQTPLEILKKFKMIKIEFHPKLYAENLIQRCVDKLSSSFKYSISYGSVSKFPRYLFELVE